MDIVIKYYKTIQVHLTEYGRLSWLYINLFSATFLDRKM
jgi:hypothetical protein